MSKTTSTSNHTRLASLAIALGALLIGGATVASAAPTAWDMPAGSQTNFSYSGGQTLNDKIGSGTSTGSGFFFSPSGLVATAAGSFESTAPSSSSASDTLSVILSAAPTKQFSGISTGMIGDFSTSGFASVGAAGQLRVFNLDNLAAGPQVMDLDFGSSFGNLPAPGFGQSEGEFLGTANLALPSGWTNIRVELDGLVHADALFGSSVIQAKDISLEVATAPRSTTTEIPVPAAVFAAPVAAVVAWKARRKLVKA